MKLNSRKIATLGILTSLALIMFIIEGLFPPLFIPGAKMGLSNIFSLFTLIIFGLPEALILIVIRTVLGCFFAGSLSALIYSLSAGVVSVLVSFVLIKFVFNKISIIAVSVVAAVIHNLVQNTIFCLISKTPQMFAYMPYLALIGVLAGLIVGIAVLMILKYLPMSLLGSMSDKPKIMEPDKTDNH